jgi:cytochrome c oxidase assembly factor CtaG
MHDMPARRPLTSKLAGAALLAGLAAAVLAVTSPIGYWSSQYIWIRASQDLLLCFAAPLLIAYGVRGHLEDRLARQAFRPTAWSRVSPVAATIAFNLACLAWHLPALFDAVQGSATAQFTEYALYLGTGIWFWVQILSPLPGPWQSPLRRLGLVTATLAAWTVVGMVLVFGSNVFYPAYVNSRHHAMTVLDDQQLSGGVLWMGMMPFVIIVGVLLLSAWLNEEASDIPASADAPVRERAWGWAARSGLR